MEQHDTILGIFGKGTPRAPITGSLRDVVDAYTDEREHYAMFGRASAASYGWDDNDEEEPMTEEDMLAQEEAINAAIAKRDRKRGLR